MEVSAIRDLGDDDETTYGFGEEAIREEEDRHSQTAAAVGEGGKRRSFCPRRNKKGGECI